MRTHLRDIPCACGSEIAFQRRAQPLIGGLKKRARPPLPREQRGRPRRSRRSGSASSAIELFTEIGHPRSRRRQHPEVPTEIKDKVVVELLALLGPDLGAEGEAILRRVGKHAASWLAPALEEVLTGRALATYRRGFLAELTKAYYLDKEEDGSGFHEDGIRGHQSRSLGTTPLAAWYRGPFMPLFSDRFPKWRLCVESDAEPCRALHAL